jgi:hypothetical protein
MALSEAIRGTELGLLKELERRAKRSLCRADSGCAECGQVREVLHALRLLRMQKPRKRTSR